jgi:hypothetical protein
MMSSLRGYEPESGMAAAICEWPCGLDTPSPTFNPQV